MMRNVNTVQYEELSQEQIEAARRRRSQDRCRSLKDAAGIPKHAEQDMLQPHGVAAFAGAAMRRLTCPRSSCQPTIHLPSAKRLATPAQNPVVHLHDRPPNLLSAKLGLS